MKHDKKVMELLKRYGDDLCSPEEIVSLLRYFNNPEYEMQLKEQIGKILSAVKTGKTKKQTRDMESRLVAIFNAIKKKI